MTFSFNNQKINEIPSDNKDDFNKKIFDCGKEKYETFFQKVFNGDFLNSRSDEPT